MPVRTYVVLHWLKLRTFLACVFGPIHPSLFFGLGATLPDSLADEVVPSMSSAMSHNQTEIDMSPTTPPTPSIHSSRGNSSDDEERVARRTALIDVKVTFARTFQGDTLGTHTLRMDEETSVGRLFALARQTPGTKPGPFCLTIRKQVLKDPKHVYLKVLEIQAVQYAIRANNGDAVELRIGVTSVAPARTSRPFAIRWGRGRPPSPRRVRRV